MVSRLKKKSKIIIERKPRKTYEIKNVFKRPKPGSGVKDQNFDMIDQTFNFDNVTERKKVVTP